MKRIQRLFILTAAVALLSACATQKKRSEASWIKKFYHNTTAYYNGYFNANVLLNETLDNYNGLHQDNYNKILDVYPYLDVDNPMADAQKMDKAIEKVSVVASLHPISHWVPDCYLMMAKCQYLKHDFETAEETLQYFKETFKPGTGRKTVAQVRKEVKKMQEIAKVEEKEKKIDEKEKKETEKETAKKLKEKEKEQRTAAREEAKKQKEREREQREKDRKKGKKKVVTGGAALPKIVAPDTAATKKITPIVKPDPKKEIKKEEPKKEEEETVAPLKPQAVDVNASPTKYYFTHRPCYQEGLLWLARTYVERQRYENAQSILDQLEKDSRTFTDVRSGIAVAQAHLFLKQKNYGMAVAPLRAAIEYANRKREKARYYFILGQIFQQQNKGDEAYAAFERAYHFSTEYIMDFNAKLNLVQNAYVNGKASIEQVTADLQKMLRDIKNEDFKDQIYFTLANIAIKANDKIAAIDNLKLSLANNKNNKQQRIESYLLLARLYYKDDKFIFAKNYYDSTLQVITKLDDRYDEVNRFANSLTDVAKNLLIIQEQDSLLQIANLSPKDKRELASKIKKEREEEQRKIAAVEAAKNAAKNPTLAGAIKRSDFFAYDPNLVRSGKRDFEKSWGSDRKLEDNWRRSNRRSLTSVDTPEATTAADAVADIDVSTIFKDVPDSPEKIAIANDKLMNAMFALGGLYRDRLKNNEKTVEVLEKMLLRYPTTRHELDSWYYLYLAHTDLKNPRKAQEYYDKIVKKYPTTTYARILQDPNYLKDTQNEERKLNQYYDATYAMFQKGQFKAAKDRTWEAESMFPAEKNTLRAKFALLRAMCVGNTDGKGAYIISLKEVVAKYPDSAEQKRAKEILRVLEGEDTTAVPGMAKGGAPTNPEQTYLAEDNSVHYVIIALGGENPSEKLTDAQSAVGDYNRQNHKLDQLKVSNAIIGGETGTPVIVIRKFDNKEAAMRYYNGATKQKNFMPRSIAHELFAVTQNNYRKIITMKTVDAYRDFFKNNYLAEH